MNLWLTIFARLLPGRFRDELLGDLIEEYHRYIKPSRGRWGALGWIIQEVIGTLRAAVWYQLQRGGHMAKWRWILALVITTMSVLQSRDAGVYHSSVFVMVLVGFAIVIPVMSFLLAGSPLIGGLIAAILLTKARIFSPISLPELHISLIFLFLFPLIFEIISQKQLTPSAS
jgi:hypothetical protein